jgi:type VI secretion system secreted protein VgrG
MTDSTSPSLPGNISSSRLSQNARLITLETAQGSDLPESLVVESFSGSEAINTLFSFDIDALSLSTDVDLQQFIGDEITLRLLQADGSQRAWHGYCTETAWLGADGGTARYRLRLEPFLAFLHIRRDAFIFQDKDVRQIITELLADYPQANVVWDITQALAIRPICTQYRESDLAFFTRILASEGLSFRFEHEQDQTQDAGNSRASSPASASNTGNNAHTRHTLIIFDSQAVIPDMPGTRELRFHGIRATEATDSIREFAASRQLQPNAISLSSWDATQVSAPAATSVSTLEHGELPELALYEGSAERLLANTAAAELYSRLRLQAMELGNKTFNGAGAIRQLAAGHGFSLTQHDNYPEGENEFTVLAVTHQATNNLDGGMTRLLSANALSARPLERGTYRNQFSSVRSSVALVPPLTALRRAPTAPGSQIALVVGMEGAPLTTERDHRIKLQFPWQRGSVPQAGGLNHTDTSVDTDGNAPGNETSGTWVRLAESLSGPNWGTHFTPRIGTEVLVNFIEGDMDRPLVVASLYNEADAPPFPAGVDSGVNHAGMISGIHSHNLQDGGYNQWVVDDSPSQLRMRLASSSAATQLNLGYLITQVPTSAQRGAYRGQGFELRSDGWGVVRGAEGVLLSTTARNRQGSSVTSTQMDGAECVAQLKGAQSLSAALTQAAGHQTALTSLPANQAQLDLIKAIDPKQQGKYTAAVHGQAISKAGAGSRMLDTAQPVEKFATPFILLDSTSTLNLASPASTTVFAGQQLHWTTQADTHWAVAYTLAAVSGNATTLFTHAGGIQVIAANAPLSLQAHTDSLEILADQAITVMSVRDHIVLKAKRKITLQAGQSSIVLEGINITYTCPGEFTVRGARRTFERAGRLGAELVKLPDDHLSPTPETPVTLLKNRYVAHYQLFKSDGRPFEGYRYQVNADADKQRAEGHTDRDGYTSFVSKEGTEIPINAYKGMMRESERITENWQGKLANRIAPLQGNV